RLLFQQLLGDEAEATNLATGWDGDRYQVLGAKSDALVWYSVWDDAAAALRFTGGLQRAWAKRRPDPKARRSEIKQLTIQGRPVVRLVDAPNDWKRSEEHTSELQSRGHLVCRLLLEKKKGNRGCTVACKIRSITSRMITMCKG